MSDRDAAFEAPNPQTPLPLPTPAGLHTKSWPP